MISDSHSRPLLAGKFSETVEPLTFAWEQRSAASPWLLLGPGGVVRVLAAAGDIHSRCLDVTVGEWCDPDIRPCWRDAEVLDARAQFRIRDNGSIEGAVQEPLAGSHPLEAVTGAVTSAQP